MLFTTEYCPSEWLKRLQEKSVRDRFQLRSACIDQAS